MFNGEILKQLRLLYGMSRKDLAEKLNITEQAVWQFEKSSISPKASIKLKMSQIFGVRSDYFSGDRLSNKFDMSLVAFRNESDVTRKSIEIQNAYLNTLYSLVTYLETMVNIYKMSILNLSEQVSKMFSDGVKLEEIALFAKRFLNISKDNSDLLFKLEKSGIYVFEHDMLADEDAYSIWSVDDRPFIILGIGKTAVRRNFDLAHELGHILLHRGIDFSTLTREEFLEKESEANNFASYFLLPEETFREDMINLVGKRVSNPDNYISLKQKYLVSIQALEYRAFKLGMVTASQHSYFYRLIHKNEYKFFEPLDGDIVVKRPSKIRSVFHTILTSNFFTLNGLLAGLKVDIRFICSLLAIDSSFFDKYADVDNIEDFNKIISLEDVRKTR